MAWAAPAPALRQNRSKSVIATPRAADLRITRSRSNSVLVTPVASPPPLIATGSSGSSTGSRRRNGPLSPPWRGVAEETALVERLLLSDESKVVCEGEVDMEEAAPGAGMKARGGSWSASSKWLGRHLTLLGDGTLCCGPARRADGGPSGMATRLPLHGSLCVRCPAGVAYGKRPHAFCVQTRSRHHYFACSSHEEADQWVDHIIDAISALEGTASVHDQHHHRPQAARPTSARRGSRREATGTPGTDAAAAPASPRRLAAATRR